MALDSNSQPSPIDLVLIDNAKTRSQCRKWSLVFIALMILQSASVGFNVAGIILGKSPFSRATSLGAAVICAATFGLNLRSFIRNRKFARELDEWRERIELAKMWFIESPH